MPGRSAERSVLPASNPVGDHPYFFPTLRLLVIEPVILVQAVRRSKTQVNGKIGRTPDDPFVTPVRLRWGS